MSSTRLVTQETGVTENERASSRTAHILPERWKAPIVARVWTSEICDCLRQQVGDAGYASSTMQPFDLTNRSRRSEGGQIVQELNPIREGECWDDAKGGWLASVLVRKAREEEVQCGVRKGHHEPVLEGDGEKPHSRLAGRTRTRESPSVGT